MNTPELAAQLEDCLHLAKRDIAAADKEMFKNARGSDFLSVWVCWFCVFEHDGQNMLKMKSGETIQTMWTTDILHYQCKTENLYDI